jgi:hypothetical protein
MRARAPRRFRKQRTCALYGVTAQSVFLTLAVHERSADEGSEFLGDLVRLLNGRAAVTNVRNRQEAKACSGQPGRIDALPRACIHRSESTFVGRLRDEAADVHVHPPRAREKEAAIGRDGVIRAEQVLQDGCPRSLGMNALGDLPKLLRITEQDDVPRAGPQCERVGQRHLTCLVDEQRVHDAFHIFPREQPRGAGEEQTSSAGSEKCA